MSDDDGGDHDDQYSGMRPLVEVASAKDSFRCSLTLKQIQKELKKLTDMAHQGIDIDEARFDYLLRAQEHNEEYKLWLAEEKATWRESVYEFAEQCLERTRTFVPVNVFESSADDLVQLGLTPELAKRVLQRQCLWLVRMSKAEIASLHESDLLGRYNSSAQHMDIIETAAIYIALPDKFNGDEAGRKAEWRDQAEENLRRMLQDNDNGQLPEGRLRNPAYDGLQFGPVEDVTSVRETNIISGRHSHRPRRSFMEVCKAHSILSVLKAEDPTGDSSDSDAENGAGKFQDEYEDVEDEEEEEVQVVDDANPLKFGSSNSLVPTFQRATSYATRDFVDESFDEGDEHEDEKASLEDIPEEATAEEAAVAEEEEERTGKVEEVEEEEEEGIERDDSPNQDIVEQKDEGEAEAVEKEEEGISADASPAANGEGNSTMTPELAAGYEEAQESSAQDDQNEAEQPDEDHTHEEDTLEEDGDGQNETEADAEKADAEAEGNAGVVDDAIIDQLAQLEAEAVAEIAAAMQARSSASLDTDYCMVHADDVAPLTVDEEGPEPEAVEVDADFGYEGDDLSSSSEESNGDDDDDAGSGDEQGEDCEQ